MSSGRGLVVHNHLAILNANKTMSKRTHNLYCAPKAHSSEGGLILTVGDGDFSFSLSLTMELELRNRTTGMSRLVATSYDPLAQVLAKYPASAVTLDSLKSQGVCRLHNVDATQLIPSLDKSLAISIAQKRPGFTPPPSSTFTRAFSRIIFNYPAVASATAMHGAEAKILLTDFFRAAQPALAPPTVPSVSAAARAAGLPADAAGLPELPLCETAAINASKQSYNAIPSVPATNSSSSSANAKGGNGKQQSQQQPAALAAGSAVDTDAVFGGQVHVTLRTTSAYAAWEVDCATSTTSHAA